MKTYQNLKKGTRTGLAVTYVLCLLIIAKSLAEIVPSIQSHNIFAASFAFLDMTMIVAVFWYSITGYKIPHGNAMKYLFFCIRNLSCIRRNIKACRKELVSHW